LQPLPLQVIKPSLLETPFAKERLSKDFAKVLHLLQTKDREIARLRRYLERVAEKRGDLEANLVCVEAKWAELDGELNSALARLKSGAPSASARKAQPLFGALSETAGDTKMDGGDRNRGSVKEDLARRSAFTCRVMQAVLAEVTRVTDAEAQIAALLRTGGAPANGFGEKITPLLQRVQAAEAGRSKLQALRAAADTKALKLAQDLERERATSRALKTRASLLDSELRQLSVKAARMDHRAQEARAKYNAAVTEHKALLDAARKGGMGGARSDGAAGPAGYDGAAGPAARASGEGMRDTHGTSCAPCAADLGSRRREREVGGALRVEARRHGGGGSEDLKKGCMKQ
jgi:hypothetical protein